MRTMQKGIYIPGPKKDPLEVEKENASGPGRECCAECRYWFRELQREHGPGLIAPCRRFPGTTLLVPSPAASLDPRQLNLNAQVMPVMKTGRDWCGEFSLYAVR